MSGMVKLDGLDALMRELTDAPASIRHEARAIVHETTESAAAELAHQYPVRSGTLRSRVRTLYPSSAALVGIAQSAAPHAHLFHFGTAARRTQRGANRGTMPRAEVPNVVAIARRWRESMTTRLMALLASRGFLVSRD